MKITQDITQALKDTENSLRDFISVVLGAKLGESWIEKCGVSSQKLEKWKKHKADEEKRQLSGVVEQRLIYYANFDDLITVLEKHWQGEFSNAFGEWDRMEVFLKELKNLRDPDAHRRGRFGLRGVGATGGEVGPRPHTHRRRPARYHLALLLRGARRGVEARGRGC